MSDVKYAVRCPSCGRQAIALMTRTGKIGTYREPIIRRAAGRIVCGRCGLHRELSDDQSGEYELWYATEFKGHRLWANNLKHLDFLIEWLSGGRRRRRPRFPEYNEAEVLPKWFKARKNEAALLECLTRLRAKEER